MPPRSDRPRLLFISPQFLFPMDAGGKIRTANILKRLKGGKFEITLIAPASASERERWRAEIGALCDHFAAWRPPDEERNYAFRRAAGVLAPLPVSVGCEVTPAAKNAVKAAMSPAPDLILFDYAHSRALANEDLPAPSLVFAHNVETEIFQRHVTQARFPMNLIWRWESAKMARYERRAMQSVDGVIAVSDRDAEIFRDSFNVLFARSVPTGVDLDFFSYQAPQENDAPMVTFTGSMDWRANQDGLHWFMDDVWPRIAQQIPDAEFVAVGKNPPQFLTDAARQRELNWRFTGFVDDVRDHARGAVYVIPLRVGGGTRIKAFEAMAMGVPVVSTTLGVEGLPVKDDRHFLLADDPNVFADKVVSLLRNHQARAALSSAARKLVEGNFGHEAAARAFEEHCVAILSANRE